MNLLAHCEGANLAALYAVRYAECIGKVVLIAPSALAVGISATSDVRRETVRLREDEPWFAPAPAAFETIQSGQATDDDWEAVTPFTYGRWDTAARVRRCRRVAAAQRLRTSAPGFGSHRFLLLRRRISLRSAGTCSAGG